MNYYYIEQTDIFGGEANYSYCWRSIIRGKSALGAIQRYSRLSGMAWHSVGCGRYDSYSGATCVFIEEYDSDQPNDYRLITDDRDPNVK